MLADIASQVSEHLLLTWFDKWLVEHGVILSLPNPMQMKGTLPPHEVTDAIRLAAISRTLELGFILTEVHASLDAFEGSSFETTQIAVVLAQI